ncbi:M1 family aminopeptidase [Kribbella sp. NPDC051587]|uniref:M1 family aminopeptidase n=1 Tax=Kribbella sp. NPDC051587 TaxID=3364119 RepID=UPI003797AF12
MRIQRLLTSGLAVLVFAGWTPGPGMAAPTEATTDNAPAAVGAAGIGDAVWPEEGNGGYDVLDQRLAFRFATDLSKYTASTALSARATQDLDRFDLDLLGPKVERVRVNGRLAAWASTSEGELVITPASRIHNGAHFVVEVSVTNTVPVAATPADLPASGLFRSAGWIQSINQPAAARRMLAVSDHPAQKAPATFVITAPSSLNSIANGKLLRTVRLGGLTTRVFREDRRIATELMQIGVGPFTVVRRRGPHGLELRYAVPTARLAEIEPQLDAFDASVRFMESRLGRFPGDRAGALITPYGGELETQGLTLLKADLMTKKGFEQESGATIVLHEVSHEWFGNSVSPKRWSDVWLNEGHATFYHQEWIATHGGGPQVDVTRSTYEELGNKLLKNGPIALPDPATFPGPVASFRPYSNAAYLGGALVLFALEQQVGKATFTKIERAWVSEHANGVGGTDDFISTASRVGGSDLAPFLRSWLYGTSLPRMPGHPDWRPAAA